MGIFDSTFLAVYSPRHVAINGAACYSLWLHTLSKCNRSPYISQPSNKSKVSTLWLSDIVFDNSSLESFPHFHEGCLQFLKGRSNTVFLSVLSSGEVAKVEFFGLSLLVQFDLLVLGLLVLRTSSYTDAPCNNWHFVSSTSTILFSYTKTADS